ncbi:MAG: CRISPR-associated endonuclease Cas2 [Thermodesulfobacteriota bacterium]|nr:MAG: CRISPR-associated endonuclease Cas2 [Thermodesulfobacteriota bacterium]
MSNRSLVVISYDISDDKRRNRISKLLENYGKRVQKSVFECFLTPEMCDEVKHRIMEILDKRQDRARIYPICHACLKQAEISGFAEVPEEEEFVVV